MITSTFNRYNHKINLPHNTAISMYTSQDSNMVCSATSTPHHYDQNQPTTHRNLPRELWQLIFTSLTTTSTRSGTLPFDPLIWQPWIASCALVCQEWYRIATPILWKHPHWKDSIHLNKFLRVIESRSTSSSSSLSNHDQRIMRGPDHFKTFSCPHLVFLNNELTTSRALSHLCEAVPDLENLSLPRLTLLQDSSVCQIAVSFGHCLISLDLSYCRLITDTCIQIVSGFFAPYKTLRNLSLRGVSKLGDLGLISLGEAVGSCLVRIDFSYCPCITDMGLVRFCEQVVSDSLNLCRAPKNESGRLKHLLFRSCPKISRTGLLHAIQLLQSHLKTGLETIEFDCPSASSHPFKSFPALSLATSIKSLHIKNARDLFDDQCKLIIDHLAPNLTALSLDYAIHLSQGTLSDLIHALTTISWLSLRKLPRRLQHQVIPILSESLVLGRLESLDLSKNDVLTDNDVLLLCTVVSHLGTGISSKPLMYWPAKLQRLSISGCVRVSVQAMKEIVKELVCSSLVYVDMTGTDGAIQAQDAIIRCLHSSIENRIPEISPAHFDEKGNLMELRRRPWLTEWDRLSAVSADCVGILELATIRPTMAHDARRLDGLPRFSFVLDGFAILSLFAQCPLPHI